MGSSQSSSQYTKIRKEIEKLPVGKIDYESFYKKIDDAVIKGTERHSLVSLLKEKEKREKNNNPNPKNDLLGPNIANVKRDNVGKISQRESETIIKEVKNQTSTSESRQGSIRKRSTKKKSRRKTPPPIVVKAEEKGTREEPSTVVKTPAKGTKKGPSTVVKTEEKETEIVPSPTVAKPDEKETEKVTLPTVVKTEEKETKKEPTPTIVKTEEKETETVPFPTVVKTEERETEKVTSPTVAKTEEKETKKKPTPTVVKAEEKETEKVPSSTVVKTEEQENANEKPLEILEIHKYFEDVDINSFDKLEYPERIEAIYQHAQTLEKDVDHFEDEMYSLAYFVLDEKLMRLLEKLDKIKCSASETLTKKKLKVITYIDHLHKSLDLHAKT